MRVLVTGGHGFIGAHVLRELIADGHEVGCLDVSEPSPVVAPVTDPVDVYDAIASVELDRIVHLAGLLGYASQASPRSAVEVNTGGTFNVLEAAGSLGVDRVVAASSAAVYGEGGDNVDRLDETVPRQPTTMYGLTKLVVEHVGPIYRERRGVQFAALEPIHGLGPGRRRGNLQDDCIVKAAVAGERIPVPARSRPFEIVYSKTRHGRSSTRPSPTTCPAIDTSLVVANGRALSRSLRSSKTTSPMQRSNLRLWRAEIS